MRRGHKRTLATEANQLNMHDGAFVFMHLQLCWAVSQPGTIPMWQRALNDTGGGGHVSTAWQPAQSTLWHA